MVNETDDSIYALSDEDKGTIIQVKVPQYGLESNIIDISDDSTNETIPATVELTRDEDTITAQLKKSDGEDFTTEAAVSYEWYRDNELVSETDDSRYTLSYEDRGTSIQVKVPKYSLESNIIDISDDSTTPAAVTIKGIARVGKTLEAMLLTGSEEEFTADSTVTYKWYRSSGEDFYDETLVGENKTYTLVSKDAGKYIKVKAEYNGIEFDDFIGPIQKKVSSSNSHSSSNNHESDTVSSNNTQENINQSNTAEVNGWVNKEDGSSKYLENGNVATGWRQIDGSWYLFDSTGVMQEGWKQLGSDWYYLGEHGIMETGWKMLGGKWYYLKDTGSMATSWIYLNNKWYYLNNGGAMETGWVKVEGKWYYFYGDGSMASDTSINGYMVNSDGVWIE